MPSPAYRSHTLTAYSASDTSDIVTKPSGVADGDILLFFLYFDVLTVLKAVTWPSGFVELQRAINTSTTGQEVQTSVAWKLAGASEPATYTASWTGACGNKSVVAAYSGAIAAPIEGSGLTQLSGAGVIVTCPTVTALTANALLVCCGMKWNTGAWGSFGALTSRETNAVLCVADQTLTASGATGTRDIACPSESGRNGVSIILASPQTLMESLVPMPGFHPGAGPLDIARFYQSPNVSYEIPYVVATTDGVASSDGLSTATATGMALFLGVASSSGLGVATGVGAATTAGVGSSAGLGAATAVGVGIGSGVASSSGVGTATAIGRAFDASVAATAGTSTVSGVGISTAASTASAAGTGVATGIATATAASVAASAGTSTVTGVGSATAAAVANAAGTSTATAVGDIVGTIASGTGSVVGTSIVTGTGISTAASVVASVGTGTATATGAATFAGVASTSGVGVVTGIGAATTASVASAIGTSTAQATASAVANVGYAAGTSTVLGVGASTAASVASASGFGVALGVADGGAGQGGYFGPETYIQRRPLPVLGEDTDEADAETVAILVAAMEIYREDSHAG